MSSSEFSIISDQRSDNLSLIPDLGAGVTSDKPPVLMEADIRHLVTLIIVMIILIVILIVSFVLNIVIIIIHINNHSLKTVSNRYQFIQLYSTLNCIYYAMFDFYPIPLIFTELFPYILLVTLELKSCRITLCSVGPLTKTCLSFSAAFGSCNTIFLSQTNKGFH